jgi:glycosyltransferase involved in cell wall biosynthesis
MKNADKSAGSMDSTPGHLPSSHPAVFVLPHFNNGTAQELQSLRGALESIRNQTDDHWRAILVDDASPGSEIKSCLSQWSREFGGRLDVVYSQENCGPGSARNLGVQRAHEAGYPYVLFLDADDLAHPKRVEVTRRLFQENPEVGVIYSTFEVIDELGKPVPRERLTPSILEILEVHETDPPQGDDVWISIATRTGYINLTSATAVRTDVAHACPFPCERVSEDFCAWLAYSARGARYLYAPSIPAKYRIPQGVEGSASRSREGGVRQFNLTKSRVDVLGFETAISMARERRALSNEQERTIRRQFFLRRAVSMNKDGERDLAEDFYRRALHAETAQL